MFACAGGQLRCCALAAGAVGGANQGSAQLLRARAERRARAGEIPAGRGGGHRGVDEEFQGVSRSARSKHFIVAVIDPPVTEDERLTDALAAFGLLCDRAIEYLDLFTWADAESASGNGSTPA